MTEETLNSKWLTEMAEYLVEQVGCSAEEVKDFIWIHGDAVWESSKTSYPSPIIPFPKALVDHFNSLAWPGNLNRTNKKDHVDEVVPSIRAVLKYWFNKIKCRIK